MILETVHEAPSGTVRVTDGMAVGPDERGHQLGTRSPGLVLRHVECVSGTATVELEFAPRPEYGLVEPLLALVPGGLVARGGASILTLSCPFPPEVYGPTARRTVELSAGDRFCLSLEHRTSSQGAAEAAPEAAAAERLQDTIRGWRTWSDLHQAYVGPWRDLVRHSGRVLQALTFQPTGAIVAAPTTSLPEAAGGERNWDYRFTWVRDASLTLEALWVAACPDEADHFFSWMAAAAAGRVVDQDLQIMFGVGGEHDLTERELPHLAGWKASSPVRIGNGAAQQFQLDTFGELLDTAWLWRRHGGEIDEIFWDFLSRCGGVVLEKWREPDQGIWEIRGEPRHFVYSKVMAWVALDRLVRLAELDGREADARWAETRDEIRALVEREGVDADSGAFVQYFGSKTLDAANLMIPIVGFVPHDDPRARATTDRIADELSADGFVYRYVADGVDGLSGEEATFAICSFWLVECLARAGEGERARELFERLLGFCNDVGLLAEEIDPHSGELIGNFPQAFSHLGLIQAAIALEMPEHSMTMMEAAEPTSV
jgi:GH15 family glucan-1,4-alpha-glucosidase